jgi:uncharacterized protein YrrD
MQFRKSAHVVSHTGQHLGHLHRVGVNPEDGEVTHLVVQKGHLFKEDKVIPVNEIASTTEAQS